MHFTYWCSLYQKPEIIQWFSQKVDSFDGPLEKCGETAVKEEQGKISAPCFSAIAKSSRLLKMPQFRVPIRAVPAASGRGWNAAGVKLISAPANAVFRLETLFDCFPVANQVTSPPYAKPGKADGPMNLRNTPGIQTK